MVRDTMPAWLVSISGADLSRDGEVTVTVDRALNHILRDANGNARPDETFRIDPDPRSHNVLAGRIKDGVLSADAGHVFLLGDQYFLDQFDFTHFRLRVTLKPDGTADGVLGGYLPWMPIYFQHAGNGLNAETFRGMDVVGLYHALARMADADPDPATGQNRRISTGWQIELVPAFAIPSERRETPRRQARPLVRTSQK
jgi:hypothetical protein